jgi:hypothetical protein
MRGIAAYAASTWLIGVAGGLTVLGIDALML